MFDLHTALVQLLRSGSHVAHGTVQFGATDYRTLTISWFRVGTASVATFDLTPTDSCQVSLRNVVASRDGDTFACSANSVAAIELWQVGGILCLDRWKAGVSAIVLETRDEKVSEVLAALKRFDGVLTGARIDEIVWDNVVGENIELPGMSLAAFDGRLIFSNIVIDHLSYKWDILLDGTCAAITAPFDDRLTLHCAESPERHRVKLQDRLALTNTNSVTAALIDPCVIRTGAASLSVLCEDGINRLVKATGQVDIQIKRSFASAGSADVQLVVSGSHLRGTFATIGDPPCLSNVTFDVGGHFELFCHSRKNTGSQPLVLRLTGSDIDATVESVSIAGMTADTIHVSAGGLSWASAGSAGTFECRGMKVSAESLALPGVTAQGLSNASGHFQLSILPSAQRALTLSLQRCSVQTLALVLPAANTVTLVNSLLLLDSRLQDVNATSVATHSQLVAHSGSGQILFDGWGVNNAAVSFVGTGVNARSGGPLEGSMSLVAVPADFGHDMTLSLPGGGLHWPGDAVIIETGNITEATAQKLIMNIVVGQKESNHVDLVAATLKVTALKVELDGSPTTITSLDDRTLSVQLRKLTYELTDGVEGLVCASLYTGGGVTSSDFQLDFGLLQIEASPKTIDLSVDCPERAQVTVFAVCGGDRSSLVLQQGESVGIDELVVMSTIWPDKMKFDVCGDMTASCRVSLVEIRKHVEANWSDEILVADLERLLALAALLGWGTVAGAVQSVNQWLADHNIEVDIGIYIKPSGDMSADYVRRNSDVIEYEGSANIDHIEGYVRLEAGSLGHRDFDLGSANLSVDLGEFSGELPFSIAEGSGLVTIGDASVHLDNDQLYHEFASSIARALKDRAIASGPINLPAGAGVGQVEVDDSGGAIDIAIRMRSSKVCRRL